MTISHTIKKIFSAPWAARIAAGLALIFVVMTGATWWLIESLDFKRVVASVERATEEAIGRPLTIGSKPQLSFLPLPTLVVRDVTLGNMKGGTRPEMLKLDRLELGIALAPLFKGKRPGLSIALIEPDLLLEVNERGERNWTLKLTPEEALARFKEAVSILSGKIAFEAVRIERATVRFEDRSVARKIALSARLAVLEQRNAGRFDFELDAELNGKPVTMLAEFQVPGPGELVPTRLKLSLPGAKLSAEGVVRPAWPSQGTELKVTGEFHDVSQLGNLLGIRLGKLPPGKLDAQLQGNEQGMRAASLRLALGRSSLSGDIEMTRIEPRLQIRATLEAPLLDFTELLVASGAPNAAPQAGDGRIFPAMKLPLAALHSLDVESQLKARRVILSGTQTLEGMQANLSLANGRLRIDPFILAAGAGQIRGRLRLDARSTKTATAEAELQTKGTVGLGSLITLMGLRGSEIKGGPTLMSIKLAANGDSVRAMMATLNGHMRIEVGGGRLPGKSADWSGTTVGRIVDILNPYRLRDDGSPLNCMAINVPVRRGVIEIKDTVGAETDKVVGTVIGSVDLGQERLDLALHSQSVGLAPGLADYASVARLTGNLGKPELVADAKGVAAAGLRIGAAIASAGVTLLAESLARSAMPAHPCKVALAAKNKVEGDPVQTDPADDAGKKSGLFGRMLGK